MGNWRESVYKMHIESGLNDREWKQIKNKVIKRDKNTCFRCDKTFRSKADLSAHHIKPRADGGSNDQSNLITLCFPCHNHVEISGLKGKADIMGSYDMPMIEITKMIFNEEGLREESFKRPDWHKFVYGGMRI